MTTPRRVPFFDLQASLNPIKAEIRDAFDEVTNSGAFVGGAAVAEFEQEYARYCDAKHCIGVGNGTDALELVLCALGIGPGDEVIVPANTFVASAEAVVNVGASVVFADVDPDTLLLRPDDAEPLINARTAAVIAVHLFGQMCDVVGLAALAERRGIVLVEDAAQAHGASVSGHPPGALSSAATFSFYPGKNLGALGDGGAVVTNDLRLSESIRSLSAHGRSVEDRYLHDLVGRNSRLDTLQAAFLSLRLGQLEAENTHRRLIRRLYAENLPGEVALVRQDPSGISSNHLVVAQVEGRSDFRSALQARGISTGVHYPKPCHMQSAFRSGEAVDSLPVVEAAAERIVSLPVWGYMPEDDVLFVCKQVEELVG